MTTKQIEFWFDFSSTYAYFAAFEIDDLAANLGHTVLWRPFMLGQAFKVTGARGLTSTPIKGDYARHDWERLSRKTGLPNRPPDSHPIVALPASRAFYWIEQHRPKKAIPFAKAVFKAYFGRSQDLMDPNRVALLGDPLGIAPKDLLAGLTSEAIKTQFKAINEEALEKGVFGSPYFIVDGEPFWGWDRLPMLKEWIEAGGW